MKQNFYLISLLLSLVLGMTIFTACGGDDDNSDLTADQGTDGLKGYWLQNTWSETYLEKWYFYPSRDEEIMGQESNMIYLDGDGGGTIYFAVTTPDHAANNAKYIADKIGTFLDSADGTTKDYHFIKKYWHSDVMTLGGNLEDISTGKSYPIEYYVKGTTMTIYYNNVTQSMQLNVSSGNVNGYHRLKKVN